MSLFHKIKTLLHNPWTLGQKMVEWTHWMWSDATYLRLYYFFCMKKPLHLKHPKTFNEKLQWLKLYDRNPLYAKLVDKYEVKKYVAERIGAEYVIPTLGMWNNPSQIGFDQLPEQFVLKTTFGGGTCGVAICKDKNSTNKENLVKKIAAAMSQDIYRENREWPYKNVPKRIIAEEYMSDSSEENRGGLTDYKFFCFNGKADCVMVSIDRHIGDTKFYFFDRKWTLKRLNYRGLNAPKDFTLPKPDKMDDMFALADKLSEGIPFVRIDLYFVNGRIYFGEYTFYPDAGFDSNLLPETDVYLGKLLELPLN